MWFLFTQRKKSKQSKYITARHMRTFLFAHWINDPGAGRTNRLNRGRRACSALVNMYMRGKVQICWRQLILDNATITKKLLQGLFGTSLRPHRVIAPSAFAASRPAQMNHTTGTKPSTFENALTEWNLCYCCLAVNVSTNYPLKCIGTVFTAAVCT